MISSHSTMKGIFRHPHLPLEPASGKEKKPTAAKLSIMRTDKHRTQRPPPDIPRLCLIPRLAKEEPK